MQATYNPTTDPLFDLNVPLESLGLGSASPVGGEAAAEVIRNEELTNYKVEYQEGDTAWYVYTRKATEARALEFVANLAKLPAYSRRNWRVVKHTQTNHEEVVARPA